MLLQNKTLMFCVIFFLLRTSVIQSMHHIFNHNSYIKRYVTSLLNVEKENNQQQIREETTWVSIFLSSIELYLLFFLGFLPDISNIPFISFESIILCLLSHILPVEFIYYWVHRLMHHPYVYSSLHKHHHLSVVPTPKTSVAFLPLEHIFYDALFAIPIIIPAYLGKCSLLQILFYVPLMDLANTFGHTNLECFSLDWYNSFLGNFFYSTSFHHIHHKYFKYNYSLFMPIYDYMFGTYSIFYTEKEHTIAYYKQNKDRSKYAFIIHIIDYLSTAKTEIYSKEFCNTNDVTKLSFIKKCLLPLWSFFVLYIFKYVPIFCRPNIVWNLLDSQTIHENNNGIIRAIPLTPKDYLKNRDSTMNLLIQSIRQLKSQYPDVKTIGLAAMNKNKLFSNNGNDLLPFLNNLGLYVVTGNTMTAACVYQYIKREIPVNSSIYINGSTSSIGHAVILKCCSSGYNVTFHTNSEERANKLLLRAKKDDIQNIKWSKDINEMKGFDFVVLGSSSDVSDKVMNTKKILSFAIPSPKVNRDKIEAGSMVLPKNTISNNAMMCSKDTTHACHAGTWIHSIKKWEFNEVGNVNYEKMEELWKIAENLGWKIIDN